MIGKGKWRKLCLLMATMLLTAWTFGQVRISGKITSTSGVSAESVAVTVKGTKFGGLADNNGMYSFTAPLTAGKYTLVFTGVGFQSQETALTIGSDKTYSVDMLLSDKISKLDEVVVTGTSAGTTRRQLGSYISSVKADELTKGSTGNVLSALQGKTAGAQITQNSGDPAGGMSVRLRGISTISGSTEPLYIIDGVIIDNSTTRVTNADPGYNGTNTVGTIGQNRLVDINPNDIERIEVLNGAAAAAIYGSRANAGVVQIFTKKGSSGEPVVSYTNSETFSSLRRRLDVNRSPTKFGGDPAVQTQTILTPTLVNTTPVNRYDYQDYIFRNAMGTDNTVSVSGGKDKTKYYASASYFYNEGIVKNTDFGRYSLRLNIDQVLNKWATFNVNMNYIYSKSNEKPDGNSFYSPTNAVTIIGNYYDITKRDALGNIQAVGERGRVNPVSIIEDFRQQEQTSRAITGAGLKLTPIKNLVVDFHSGIDNYSQSGTTFIPPYAYNVSTGFYGGGPTLDPTLNGYASAASYNYFQINHDLNATYNWAINSKWSSVTQVGYSMQYQKTNYVLSQGKGLAPFVQTVDGASTVIPGSDARSELSVWGEFIQQNFKYRNQLFVTGAIRFDGSSVFGPTQRNQVYKKLSGSYVISGTDFWGKMGVSKWWNLLKVRAAYGEAGNLTGISAYSRFNNYGSSSFLGQTSFQTSTQLANTNVRPERQNEIEIGADIAFFDNRLGLTFNYYHKRVDDLLISRSIAPSNGFSSLLDNVGSLQNVGYEVVLNAVPLKSKDFNWDLTLIYNHNRNKALDIGQSIILYANNGGAPVGILQNQPIGVFYGTFFARDANNNLVKNASGIPLTEAGVQTSVSSYTTQRDASGLPTGTALQKVIGNPNPKYTATLTNDFSYKKFGLHIQLDAVQGVDVFNADFRTRQGVDNGKVAEQEDLGQIPRGYIAGVYGIQEWRVDDGSFVKLRELAISYNIGKLKCFKDLKISIGGRNLISWDKYKGYDPEVNAAGQSTILRGIDFGSVPAPKTFSVGISAKF
jgi:TonB-linked SusC/RagA family outer membrane protein